ncbi:MAG: DMT family transporter [Actinobacteria bacterium]|nr:DMT family transporter [Actinomycetota bacterium]
MRWKLAVATLATSWGLIAVIVRKVDLDAQVLAFYRLAFAGATLLFVAVVLRRLGLLRLTRHRGVVALIGVTLAAHWFLYFATIKLSSVAVAVLLAYLAPLAIALLAPLVLPERRSRVALAALVPAGAGVALVALGGVDGGAVRPFALLTGLLTAATYAALVLLTKRIVADLPVLTLSFWTYAIAAIAVSPLLLDADRVLPTANELPAVLALGVVFTALSGYLYIWSLRHVTAQTIGILAYIEPVSAALMAWAFLGESLDWQIVVGGALVIAAGATVVFLEPEDAAAPEVVPLGSRS